MDSFQLITLDLDYTIFLGNSIVYLNRILGISDKLERYHADYHNGRITERELNLLQTPILEQLSVSKSFEQLANGPLLKNLDNGVRMLRDAGCDVQMLTLNPLQLFFKNNHGINADMSVFEINRDNFKLVKEFPKNKAVLLRKYCLARGISLINCAHVGDALNDIETFGRVGYSIALNSSSLNVRKMASVSLQTEDFLDVANTIIRANDLA